MVAQKDTSKPKPYMIGAIRAQLWYPNTGRLSKNILGDKNFVPGTSSATGYYAKTAELILMAFLLADRPKS